ncbi:MAG: hypothetical protein Q8N51_19600 [Gammaproteobacteria bacterium]|nr:hypothetical protein [Gammaproteobacteria bacterium]
MKNWRGRITIVAALCAVGILVATAVEAMHGTDIVLTSGASGVRLHSSRYREGWKSYDVNANGTGVIIFYRRALNAGGYPRGAVLGSWVYQVDEKAFNTGDATQVDSVSFIFSGGTATKVIVRPIN